MTGIHSQPTETEFYVERNGITRYFNVGYFNLIYDTLTKQIFQKVGLTNVRLGWDVQMNYYYSKYRVF